MAFVALPLTIAFGIASGVSPEKGIFTAVVAGMIVALFGGCRVHVAGPSGPFVVMAAWLVQQYGLDGLEIATFSAGVILLIMGRAKLGSLIKFIPYPVTAGFTSGIAIMLITTAIKDLFGLTLDKSGGSVVDQWQTIAAAVSTINPWAIAISVLSILFLLFPIKPIRRIPGSLIALIVATAAVNLFDLPVKTIGDIPTGFPIPSFPKLSYGLIVKLVQPSIVIAVLVAIEALLSAVVADGMTGETHEPNRVIIAQGLANIASSCFGCLPATSAIARTATNARNGGRTPIAALTHSLVLLLILLFFGKWASLIPLSCLSAILVFVAWRMLELKSLFAMSRNPKGDIAVLMMTLFITVFVDLDTGILIGIALAGVLFIQRMSKTTEVQLFNRELQRAEQKTAGAGRSQMPIPHGVDIYDINGPFFFGAVYKLKEALSVVSKKPKVRMIRMANVNVMDSTGLHALEEVSSMCRKQNIAFLISEIHAQPYNALNKSGLLHQFGEQNVLATFEEAIARAHEIIEATTSDKR